MPHTKKKIKDIAPSRLVYLDESGFVSELQQDKCWSEIGRPVVAERSGQRKKRVNLFCGLNSKFEAISPFLTEENCKAENFEAWFEKSFLQSVDLVTNAVIIMDNARFHRKAVLFDLIKRFNTFFDTQFSIIFLPPYSPDFNPIEKCFGVLKGKVKRLAQFGECVEQRLKSVLEI